MKMKVPGSFLPWCMCIDFLKFNMAKDYERRGDMHAKFSLYVKKQSVHIVEWACEDGTCVTRLSFLVIPSGLLQQGVDPKMTM